MFIKKDSNYISILKLNNSKKYFKPMFYSKSFYNKSFYSKLVKNCILFTILVIT